MPPKPPARILAESKKAGIRRVRPSTSCSPRRRLLSQWRNPIEITPQVSRLPPAGWKPSAPRPSADANQSQRRERRRATAAASSMTRRAGHASARPIGSSSISQTRSKAVRNAVHAGLSGFRTRIQQNRASGQDGSVSFFVLLLRASASSSPSTATVLLARLRTTPVLRLTGRHENRPPPRPARPSPLARRHTSASPAADTTPAQHPEKVEKGMSRSLLNFEGGELLSSGFYAAFRDDLKWPEGLSKTIIRRDMSRKPRTRRKRRSASSRAALTQR